MQMTSSPPNSLIKGAWEIGQWLGREKLNQYELEDCMQKAKGLAIVNQNGQALFDDIIDGVEVDLSDLSFSSSQDLWDD